MSNILLPCHALHSFKQKSGRTVTLQNSGSIEKKYEGVKYHNHKGEKSLDEGEVLGTSLTEALSLSG